MTGQERVKAYFEEAIQTDEALKNAYDEKKLNKCWDYIVKQAKKESTGNCACIEDAQVFKWARDYMYGDIEETKPNESNNSEIKQNVPEESETSGESGLSAQEVEEDESAEKEVIVQSVDNNASGECDKDSSKESAEEVPEVSINLEHKCSECGYYDEHKCLFHHYSVPNENSSACKEFVIKLTTDIKPENEKLEITVEGESAVPEPCHQKKETKKSDDYDGPWLFDFDDNGGQ